VLTGSGTNAAVYGSANINETHYYICLSTGGFLCDIRSKYGWTRIEPSQLQIAGSTIDPDQTSNRVYAISSGGKTTTSSVDRVMRLDPVVTPAQTMYDADGTAFNATITTKAYTEGDPAQHRRFRHTMLTYQLIEGISTIPANTLYPSVSLYPGGSNGTFLTTAIEGVDGLGASTLIGTTATADESASMSRYDHQTINQAISYQIDVIGAPPAFQLYEVTNGFNLLRAGRVK
jgi:hypothetical protein